MIKTKIDWCDYTINPIKGLCQGGCWYCYARRMYKRFKWPQEVTYRPEELDKITQIKEPSRIFICSTHDLFGEWIPDKWIFNIITKLQNYPQHTFLLLTKNPKRYLDFTFRDNFWLGETITDNSRTSIMKREKGINFISFEPLLGEIYQSLKYQSWIIIGALTGKDSKQFQPKIEWIDKILLEATFFNIPVFMKNNLEYVYKQNYKHYRLRQEIPVIRPGLLRAKL